MEMNYLSLVLTAVLSGIGFSLIGIASRLGQSRRVIPLHVAVGMGAAGTLFFAAKMV